MSVAYHEEEPVDEVEGYCYTHNKHFYHSEGCEHCGNDCADRALQTKLDRKGRSAACR